VNDSIRVRNWLIEALEWIGAGAKTAVGYGRMIRDTRRESEWLERERQEQIQRDQQKEIDLIKTLPAELKAIKELRELFHTGRWRSAKDAEDLLYARRAALMKQALKWENPEHKKAAAELLHEIFDVTGWGNKQKEMERRQILSQLGLESEQPKQT
jgi:CRISPR-associated protein Cmr6